MSQPIRIGMVAGEASGDILGAGLISALRKRHPHIQFEGIAGPRMQQQGCHSLFDMEELSVMGLVEVLSRIRRLLFIRKSLVEHFCANPPDVFVGIDAPDFNLGLEKRLKAKGIKTVQYVSPTVWAWREKRIFTIAEATNLVLSLLPFEKAFYDKYQVPCTFVGHTLADAIPLLPDVEAARQQFALAADDKVLALLPGSRGGEVSRLLEHFVGAVSLLVTSVPDVKVLLPAANAKRREQIETWLVEHAPSLPIMVVDGQSREVMTAADAVLLASGTAALEAMLCKKPMVVAYKFNWLTYQIAKKMVKARYFSLPNLLADEALVPELLQHEVTPEALAELLAPMLTKGAPEMVTRFAELHESLRKNADEEAAKAIEDLLGLTSS
ncbi:lipid-A-disaccharide synthase [Aliiglaciecola sp. CAU 1673]|uniref:lipid-A-disaccharide synthase n=1 Tax=Aliiglaciecola sp. CAU 1673 TaxID=3032595 RepID=UPI0023DAB2FA|nr:lipid-A-disaccharide synthase [Aliiglaciecola sp. CAU 1673]MDF2179612.1 lipid-A-disaccharide synthase [Aliiglaciecola sp. CAU 1673]